MNGDQRPMLARSIPEAASWTRAGALALIRRLYPVAHAGLWALGAATLAWIIINLPAISEARRYAEMQRAQAIEAENHAYCAKWGMRAGTHAHTICMLDLQELRANHERRLAEEAEGFF